MSVFLAYQYVWPGVITLLLGMKMIYWDSFWGFGGGGNILKNKCVSNCREDENMFLSPCRKSSYTQDVSYGLDDFKCFYSTCHGSYWN